MLHRVLGQAGLRSIRFHDALIDDHAEAQKAFFEDFMNTHREVYILTDCETFCYAFKLGATITLDVLTEGQMRESEFYSGKMRFVKVKFYPPDSFFNYCSGDRISL